MPQYLGVIEVISGAILFFIKNIDKYAAGFI